MSESIDSMLSRKNTKIHINSKLSEHFETTGALLYLSIDELTDELGQRPKRIESLLDEMVTEGVLTEKEPRKYGLTHTNLTRLIYDLKSHNKISELRYAFGDESTYKHIITYGLVAVHGHSVAAISNAFSELKIRNGVPADSHFHCREVFHPDAKKKTEWKHLDEKNILDFSEGVIRLMKEYLAVFSIGALIEEDYPEQLGDVSKLL